MSSTPFDLVGGGNVVRQIVERFYDLMEQDPAYAPLRALHAADLGPMRASLAGFLNAWLGGPRDWFLEKPGRCMMSAHRGVAMDVTVAQQWGDAMTRAIADSPVAPELGRKMAATLSDLALQMVPEEVA
jgi:hemoglobin